MQDFSALSDNELQQLAVNGNRSAEEQLILRYSRSVRACARPFFLAGGDSEDLIQEGMLGLLSAIREYNGEMNTSFKTYAELCIRHRLITAVRCAARRKHSPLNDGLSLDSILSDNPQTPSVSPYAAYRRIPEEQVLARESANEITSTFNRCLSKFESKILSLYLEGCSYQEMAAATGKGEKSVDNAVQRIRRKLAQTLYSGDTSQS